MPSNPLSAPAVAFGATCILVGILWDISWHITIGRDTFWTPAHATIYLGGALPGLLCGWMALKATFRPSDAPTVGVWGFRAPLGAWVTIWGAAAMLTSAPFDDWWHNTYGLDVTILSPPHTVLAAGMFSVVAGSMLLILAARNRAEGRSRWGNALYVYAAGILLGMITVLVTEETFPNQQHARTFYLICCGAFPLFLVGPAMATRIRWAATGTALTYMLTLAAMVWVLPFFAARPLLAPVYNPVDHMVPPAFPLLLVAPAVGIDLVLRAWKPGELGWRDALLSLAFAVAFVALFLPAQWHFAGFLLSPAAENRFFAGNRYWSYMDHLGPWCRQFFNARNDPMTGKGLALALGLAWGSALLGVWWGRWMATVRR